LKDKFSEFIDTITEKFEKVKDDVTDFADEAISKAEAEAEAKTAKSK